MTNEEIIKNYWKYARKNLDEFKKYHLKRSKKTQDKVQDIFNSLNITYQDLTKPISKNLKDKLKRNVEEFKKEKWYDGYFKYNIEKLMSGSINYNDYIEIMLIGAIMDEYDDVNDEINNIYEDNSLHYYNKGKKDLKEKPVKKNNIYKKVIALGIAGILWRDYLQGYYLTHQQNIKKEYVNRLLANKPVDVYDNAFQKVFDKDGNYLLSVKNGKYSGGIDEYLAMIANQSYLEASEDKDYKVRFVSDKCERVTAMCDYMDGMIFNTKSVNKFKRPYGQSQQDLKIEEIEVDGLVVGINQPPINRHFHWCHSIITYQYETFTEDIRRKVFKNSYRDYSAEMDKKEDFKEYNYRIGKNKFNTPSNEYLNKYVSLGINTPKKDGYDEIVNGIKELVTPAPENFKIFVGINENDILENRKLISGSLQKETAKLYTYNKKNGKVVEVNIQKGSNIISTFNAERNGDKDYFRKQAEIIIPTENNEIYEVNGRYFVKEKE